MPVPALELPVDLDPLAVAAALRHRTGTLLLHSQDGGPSALLFDPRWVLRADDHGRVGWSGDVPSPSPPPGPPLELPHRLAAMLARPRLGSGSLDLPGLAGMLGYELGVRAHATAPAPDRRFRLPELWLGAYDAALLFDSTGGPRLRVIDLSPLVPPRLPLPDRAEELLDALHRPALPAALGPATEVEDLDRDRHRRAVERIRQHLVDGDCYQINLTGFVSARTAADPWAVHLAEARDNPVTMAAYLRTEEATITSHSPERLLRLRGSRASTEPIKGTLERGPRAVDRLRASEKDRAEHVMIVDLCRNDLGRHAQFGSVRASSLMRPLELRGLVHLVSTVEARVGRTGRHHLLADLFPGGSVTGAPKRRAISIIAQLEPERRGPYTGAIGYVAPGGDMDWNIAIRTAVWQDGRVHFGCGGGIVVDSDPEVEFEEARLKARSFLRSLGVSAASDRDGEG